MLASPVVARLSSSGLLYQQISTGIEKWVQARVAADTRSQHTTQLRAISAVLRKILRQLECEQASLNNTDSGVVYENCDRFDRRVTWLERLWRFFRNRFDQRESSEFSSVLRAADELVWSCYSGPIEKATSLGLRQGPAPAPVPFLEARYSPEAFPTELVPPDLRDEAEAANLLKDHLNKMPVPVVRLAPSCVAAPWLLVYLAHETGHHLQYDLLPDRRLVSEFRKTVEAAVKTETDSGDEANKWGRWSKEIFADLFSVMAMGSWAVWAMVELDFRPSPALDQERDSYPSPATRLALLADACDRITQTTDGQAALRGLVSPLQDPIRNAVLDAALGPLPALNGRALKDVVRPDPSAFSRGVAVWRDNLLDPENEQDPQPAVENALILTGGALAAWQSVAKRRLPEKEFADTARTLGTRYLARMAAGAPEGTRVGTGESDFTGVAAAIMDQIWQETR